jgi:hypothetical protein
MRSRIEFLFGALAPEVPCIDGEDAELAAVQSSARTSEKSATSEKEDMLTEDELEDDAKVSDGMPSDEEKESDVFPEGHIYTQESDAASSSSAGQPGMAYSDWSEDAKSNTDLPFAVQFGSLEQLGGWEGSTPPTARFGDASSRSTPSSGQHTPSGCRELKLTRGAQQSMRAISAKHAAAVSAKQARADGDLWQFDVFNRMPQQPPAMPSWPCRVHQLPGLPPSRPPAVEDSARKDAQDPTQGPANAGIPAKLRRPRVHEKSHKVKSIEIDNVGDHDKGSFGEILQWQETRKRNWRMIGQFAASRGSGGWHHRKPSKEVVSQASARSSLPKKSAKEAPVMSVSTESTGREIAMSASQGMVSQFAPLRAPMQLLSQRSQSPGGESARSDVAPLPLQCSVKFQLPAAFPPSPKRAPAKTSSTKATVGPLAMVEELQVKSMRSPRRRLLSLCTPEGGTPEPHVTGDVSFFDNASEDSNLIDPAFFEDDDGALGPSLVGRNLPSPTGSPSSRRNSLFDLSVSTAAGTMTTCDERHELSFLAGGKPALICMSTGADFQMKSPRSFLFSSGTSLRKDPLLRRSATTEKGGVILK